jgi:tetratricopeptide (TPR) repeat protein
MYKELGNAYAAAGDKLSAIECHKRSLAIMERVSGGDCLGTVAGYVGLAQVYMDVRDLRKALQCYKRSLTILEMMAGPNNPVALIHLMNIGNILQLAHQWSGALYFFQEAMRRGQTDPLHVARCNHAIACVLAADGDFRQALSREKLVLQIYR